MASWLQRTKKWKKLLWCFFFLNSFMWREATRWCLTVLCVVFAERGEIFSRGLFHVTHHVAKESFQSHTHTRKVSQNNWLGEINPFWISGLNIDSWRKCSNFKLNLSGNLGWLFANIKYNNKFKRGNLKSQFVSVNFDAKCQMFWDTLCVIYIYYKERKKVWQIGLQRSIEVHFSTGASGSCLRPLIVSRDTI